MRSRLSVALVLLGLAASCSSLPATPMVPDRAFVPEQVELPGLAHDPATPFVLLPGDEVRLRTVSVEPMDLSDLSIDETGVIFLPLAGEVSVGGMTPAAASAAIEARLRDYDRFVRASVTVTKSAGHVATVVGAVERPGLVPLRPDTRLVELLALAGGPRVDVSSGELEELADVDAARVVREGKALPVSFAAAMRGEPLHNVRIRAGDVLYVPSSRGRLITIMGDVGMPKTITWRRGLRLTEAVARGAGIAKSGDGSDVRVLRGKLSAPQVYRTDLDALFDGEGHDVELAPGDVVFVGASTFWSVTEVLQRMMPALTAAALATTIANSN